MMFSAVGPKYSTNFTIYRLGSFFNFAIKLSVHDNFRTPC